MTDEEKVKITLECLKLSTQICQGRLDAGEYTLSESILAVKEHTLELIRFIYPFEDDGLYEELDQGLEANKFRYPR